MKRFLIISRSAPYGTAGAREATELALACALFDQQAALLLVDDGVFQLLPGQQPAAIQQKSLGAMQQALPMYDIDQIYVCARSLKERGLSADQLALPARPLDATELRELLQQQDYTLHV